MASSQMVIFNDSANFSLFYGGTPSQQSALAAGWTRFQQPDPATLQRFEIGSRFTYSQPGQVTAEYRLPAGALDGLYRIEAFVPGQRATVRDAQYRVAFNFRSENGSDVCDETLVTLNQGYHYDRWVPLGWFRLAPSVHPLNGRVRLSNYCIGAKSWIAFGPLRWVYIPDDQESQLYDPPVGSQEERLGPLLENAYQFINKPRWLPGWYDYTPFMEWYALGCHPGVDLNSTVSPAADKGAPVYAIADGMVTFAGAAGSWGMIVIIWHPDALVTLPNGTVQRQHIYARYGHLANLLVQSGVHVQRGQQIGRIGLMAGATAGWHLHFDLSYSEKLRQVPSYWTQHRNRPRFDVRREVLANYVDPYVFIRDNHKFKVVESKG